LADVKSFLLKSESIGDNIDLKNCVAATDPISNELLDNLATKKALDDVILIIENRFKDGQINL
jgi:hypothetical protein